MKKSGFYFVIGLGNDECGYLFSGEEFDSPQFSYERKMSLGKRAGAIVEDKLIWIVNEK